MIHGKTLFFCFCVFGLAGCTLFKEPFSVRVSVISSAFQPPVVSVYVEGTDGNALSGALVTVLSPGGEAQLLGFDTVSGCYKSKPGSTRSGSWIVTVKSALDPDPVTMAVEHVVMTTAVVVSDIRDGTGSSSSNGDSLDVTTALAITWPAVAGATAYRVLISKGTVILYEGTSATNAHLVPAGTLPASSSLSICVSAQWTSGDPLFGETAYCSSSIADGGPCHVATR